MKDKFGDLRGGCTKYGCKEYTTPEKKNKLKCGFCGHFSIKHIQLDHPMQVEHTSIVIESDHIVTEDTLIQYTYPYLTTRSAF